VAPTRTNRPGCARFQPLRRLNQNPSGRLPRQGCACDFWATWCGPCIEEIPSLLDLHHAYPDLAILAVSVDEDPDAYSQFLSRRHVDFTTVRDPSESAAKLFHTEQWPETYVIDRKGIIRRKFIGARTGQTPRYASS